jgi:5-hydroxyisourate hydrolase-like protein (transthyretin family)
MKNRNHGWTQMHTEKTERICANLSKSSPVMRTIRVYLCLSVVPLLAAVDGTVVNRTTGQPQSGATVTLYKLGQAGMESVESVKSGAGGKFRIDHTPQGPHLIQTAFDGVTYNHMLPPGSPASGLSLDVYNSSKQPGAARISRHFLIFQPNGAQMSVSEGFIFANNGTTTYNDPDGGTLKFYLPAAAKGIVQVKATAPQGMPIDRAADKTNQKGIYKIDFPIKPGETTIQVTYLVPYSSGAVFEGKTVGKTEEPTLLVVPNGVTLKGEGVESKGREPQSQASIFSVATATYKVEIAGSMPAAAAADADSGDSGPSLEEVSPKILQQNMKWILALAFGILALGFIVLYRAQPAATYRGFTVKGKKARPK